MRILYECFTACPGEGSENGNGWNIPLAMALRGHQVRVIYGNQRNGYPARIQAELERQGPAIAAANGSLEYWLTPLPRWQPWVKPGFLRAQVGYHAWIRQSVPALASQITAFAPDVCHHLTLGSLQGGSSLPLLCQAPFIHGPCGGGQMAPWRMIPGLGAGIPWEVIRNVLAWISGLGLIRPIGLNKAKLVLVSNSDTKRCAERMGASQVRITIDAMLPNDFRPPELPHRDWQAPILEVLWIAQLLPRKSVLLAVEALERLGPNPGMHLRIVGGGAEEQRLRKRLATSSAREHITVVGKIPFAQVTEEYRRSHIFFFTSIRDSFGVQLLEAQCWGLPIIAFDLHGCHDHLDARCGRLVPANQGAEGLATALRNLAQDRQALEAMSTFNHAISAERTLDGQIPQFEKIYMDCLGDTPR